MFFLSWYVFATITLFVFRSICQYSTILWNFISSNIFNYQEPLLFLFFYSNLFPFNICGTSLNLSEHFNPSDPGSCFRGTTLLASVGLFQTLVSFTSESALVEPSWSRKSGPGSSVAAMQLVCLSPLDCEGCRGFRAAGGSCLRLGNP